MRRDPEAVRLNVPAARRRTLGIVLAFVSLIVLAIFAFKTQPPKEPELNGKPLSYYLDLQTYGELRTERNARESISDFGSNAVPYLIRILEARPSPLDKLMDYVGVRIQLLEIGTTPFFLRQHQAIQACSALGTVAFPAIGALSNLVNDPLLGEAAISALVNLGPQSFPILTNCLFSSLPLTRAAAAGMLRSLPNHVESTPLLLHALHDTNQFVRCNAAGSLALVGAHDSRTVSALLQTLDDPQSDVRLEVIQGLGRLGPKAVDALPKLRELLHTEENPTFHPRIEQAIEAILSKELPTQ